MSSMIDKIDDDELLEILGLTSFSVGDSHVDVEDPSTRLKCVSLLPESRVKNLREEYRRRGIVRLDIEEVKHLLPTASDLRVWTEQVAYTGDAKKDDVLRTYETVASGKRALTRMEHFVHAHKGWRKLCETGGILSELVARVCGSPSKHRLNQPWPLYKEKLNVKPSLGTGFAPHLDAPSLQVVGLCKEFVTVMVAIDDMTVANGCLRVVEGEWSEGNAVECEKVGGDNPDGDGRRGAIVSQVAKVSFAHDDVHFMLRACGCLTAL